MLWTIILCIFAVCSFGVAVLLILAMMNSKKREENHLHKSEVILEIAEIFAFFIAGGVLLTMKNGIAESGIVNAFSWALVIVYAVLLYFCLFTPKEMNLADNNGTFNLLMSPTFIVLDLVLGINYGLKVLSLKLIIFTAIAFVIVYGIFLLRNRKKKGWKFGTFLIEILVCCLSIIAIANATIDVKLVKESEYKITDMNVNSKGGHSVVVEGGKSYYVNDKEWKHLNIGGSIVIRKYSGLLGMEWDEREVPQK